MHPGDTLVGFSEVALALAGFAAIVLVLGTSGKALDADTLANLRVMVSGAVGAAFAGLTGVAILAFQIEPPSLWILSSSIVLGGTVVGTVLNWYFIFRHSDVGAHVGLAVLWWSFPIVSCMLHLANILGVFAPPSFGLFFLALVTLLALAALQFLHSLYILLGGSAA
jgi:hypothetical protein